jgi:23S rRNA pseudouridine1911/1915/1917 synthase
MPRLLLSVARLNLAKPEPLIVSKRIPEWTVTTADRSVRLDKFLAAADRLGSRSRVGLALERGRVFLNETEMAPKDAAQRLRLGDVVRVWTDRPGSAGRRTGVFRTGDLQILYEDDVIVVVNKPAGLLTVPLPVRDAATSVYEQLTAHLGGGSRRRAYIVHRIDRDTSGLVLFAKTAHGQRALKDQFMRREPQRVYVALVHGHPDPPAGTWRDVLAWDRRALVQKKARQADPHGREAVCEYRVLETFADSALLEVRLHTGKQNQIRIQARLHGHVLVGERKYVHQSGANPSIEFSRQALHAQRLSFRHPADGRQISFEAPLPDDFSRLLRVLRAKPETARGGRI